MGLTFERPLWLGLLLPSLGIVYFLWRTSRVYLPTTRRYLALGLRMLAMTLLVGIFAQPSIKLNASDLAVAVLLDRSASISPAQRAAEESWLADALSRKSLNDQI